MKARIYAQEFKRIIDNTKRFVGFGSDKNLMQWIYLQIDSVNKEIKATALDGHRISVEYAEVESADESFSCYIKPNIPKILKADTFAELEVNNHRLYVQVGESIMGYVQPKGEYFKVDHLIDGCLRSEKVTTIGVNAQYLKDALESINLGDYYRKVAKIDMYGPKEPIIIRSKRPNDNKENIKMVLPVNIYE